MQVDAANRPYDCLEIGFYRQPCSVIGTGDKKLAQTTSRPALIPYCGLIQSTSSQRTMSARLPDFESRTISHKQRWDHITVTEDRCSLSLARTCFSASTNSIPRATAISPTSNLIPSSYSCFIVALK